MSRWGLMEGFRGKRPSPDHPPSSLLRGDVIGTFVRTGGEDIRSRGDPNGTSDHHGGSRSIWTFGQGLIERVHRDPTSPGTVDDVCRPSTRWESPDSSDPVVNPGPSVRMTILGQGRVQGPSSVLVRENVKEGRVYSPDKTYWTLQPQLLLLFGPGSRDRKEERG